MSSPPTAVLAVARTHCTRLHRGASPKRCLRSNIQMMVVSDVLRRSSFGLPHARDLEVAQEARKDQDDAILRRCSSTEPMRSPNFVRTFDKRARCTAGHLTRSGTAATRSGTQRTRSGTQRTIPTSALYCKCDHDRMVVAQSCQQSALCGDGPDARHAMSSPGTHSSLCLTQGHAQRSPDSQLYASAAAGFW